MDRALKVELIQELEVILSDIADGYSGEAKFAITVLKDKVTVSPYIDTELKRTMLEYLDQAWKALVGGYARLGTGAFPLQSIYYHLATVDVSDSLAATG